MLCSVSVVGDTVLLMLFKYQKICVAVSKEKIK